MPQRFIFNVYIYIGAGTDSGVRAYTCSHVYARTYTPLLHPALDACVLWQHSKKGANAPTNRHTHAHICTHTHTTLTHTSTTQVENTHTHPHAHNILCWTNKKMNSTKINLSVSFACKKCVSLREYCDTKHHQTQT